MANTRVPVQLTSFVGRSRELAELEVAAGAAHRRPRGRAGARQPRAAARGRVGHRGTVGGVAGPARAGHQSRSAPRPRGTGVSLGTAAATGPVELASLEDLAEVEAVKLFVERARAIDPAFALTSDNAVAVAGICARLDGLPLAIELAAARTRLFTPTALLGRLDRRLPVLTEGPMDAPIRQRTLRSTIGWSFDLLRERDQRVFASLGVFAGGFTLAAAEAVAIDPADPKGGSDMLTSLDHLVEQNVLMVGPDADGEPRFRMLETIREFAWDQLPEPDRVGLRDRHLAYFVALAERSEPQLRGPDQAVWIRRLAAEQADIRAGGRLGPGSPPGRVDAAACRGA